MGFDGAVPPGAGVETTGFCATDTLARDGEPVDAIEEASADGIAEGVLWTCDESLTGGWSAGAAASDFGGASYSGIDWGKAVESVCAAAGEDWPSAADGASAAGAGNSTIARKDFVSQWFIGRR